MKMANADHSARPNLSLTTNFFLVVMTIWRLTLSLKPYICNHRLWVKMWIHYCKLHGYHIESDDGQQQQSVTVRLSTVVCRDIISDDLIMPNCLADNVTGYTCDP